MSAETCPCCGVSLQGAPIPQEYIDAGLYEPGAAHYSRAIGYVSRDTTQFYVCPDCGGTWPRFAPDSRSYAFAEQLRAGFDDNYAQDGAA